jgi:hypothetical protein
LGQLLTTLSPQVSTANTASYEKPLSLCACTQIKFHVLLEDGGRRFLTTLGNEPLQFITRGHKILEANGMEFEHPLQNDIWKMVVKCARLGGGDMITVDVPFNNETGDYEWRKKPATIGKCNLYGLVPLVKQSTYVGFGYSWVRIFEADSARVAESKAMKADLDVVGRTYVYWQKLHKAVWSEPVVLETSDEYWKKSPTYVDEKLIEAGGKLREAYRAWMKPTKVE